MGNMKDSGDGSLSLDGDGNQPFLHRKISILVCDDHAVLRAGLMALLDLEGDMEVVGEATSGEEAIELVGRLHPDVVVLDIGLPGINGLEATRRITSEYPECRILILTMYREIHYLLNALRSGALGYVLKSDMDVELIRAIRLVYQGDAFIHSSDSRELFKTYLERGYDLNGPARLSDMETEVLKLAAQGYTSKEIGEYLSISPSTADTYRMRIMQKLGLTRRSELVRWARDYGFC